jgi:hypothetical protein
MKNQLPPNKILVNVKISLGEQFQVDIKQTATIKKLKQKIKKLRGLPVKCQMFISDGKQLQDTDILASILPINQTELKLLLVINEEQKKNKENKENKERKEFIEKETSQSLAIQPIPLEFDELSPAPSLKISFEDQHRCVQFSGTSYLKLTELCTYFFGVKNPHRMVICYQDEDSDMIQITSDAELSYALAYHTTKTQRGLKILKLHFSIKQKKNFDLPVIDDIVVQDQTEQQQKESERKLKPGAIVFLSIEKEGNRQYLSLSGDQVLFSADHSPNSHWEVESASNGKENEGSCSQFILLSNPFFASSHNKSHLRVAASGRIDHKGAKGNWARFSVQYLPNGQVKLRSVGRSLHHPERCFFGLVSQKTNRYVAVGNLPEDAPEALFNVHVISETHPQKQISTSSSLFPREQFCAKSYHNSRVKAKRH